jgi:hypothetical protein
MMTGEAGYCSMPLAENTVYYNPKIGARIEALQDTT